MSLVSLDDMKTYLGIPLVDTTYDAFLTEQLAIISEAVEGYCGRVFSLMNYTQTFYKDEIDRATQELHLFHYPLVAVSSATEGLEDISTTIRPHLPTGRIKEPSRYFFSYGDEVVIEYSAGYANIPQPIRSVVMSLVEERYNKKISGVQINFGSDVQSVSIPGTISIQFDYSLQSNERKNAFGMLLGNYANVLDMYRSERVLVGSIGVNYV